VTSGPVRLLLATGNAHKAAEVAEILGPRWEVVARDPEVDETGDTFEDNALLKARALRDATGQPAVADDSGIEIDALGGEPGVRSARWTHEGDWIPRVLRELAGVPAGARTCRYVCAAAVARPDGSEAVVRGEVEGVVVDGPRGVGGFGYDPIVAPVEGDGRTFAEMSAGEKHALSHRARAFRALVAQLPGPIGPGGGGGGGAAGGGPGGGGGG
jgi:XTP/dITP diphosphohydrolase